MAPRGNFNRAAVSRSDIAVATDLPTYFCICGEYILVGNVKFQQLARRPVDNAFVLRNVPSEKYGGKHVYKLNADVDKEAIYMQRQEGLEKIWRKRCPRCQLTVAYETVDPKEKKAGDYTFLLHGALSEEQSAVPNGAFGEEQ